MKRVRQCLALITKMERCLEDGGSTEALWPKFHRLENKLTGDELRELQKRIDRRYQ